MRLHRLNLALFGHFNDKVFDFGDKKANLADFHVIYGPNEAGKTTFTQGYLRLLYGFPSAEPYAFLHQRKNLRVSGSLLLNGRAQTFTRLTTRANSLLDEHGGVLPESALQAHLGGLNRSDYENLLCIDDDTIEKGGEEIANSKGDIGTLLFSAAAGVNDLQGILDDVDAEANGLFRSRSSKTRLAQLKAEYIALNNQIKAMDVPAAVYKSLKAEVLKSQEQEQKAKQLRSSLYEESNRLKLLLAALPKISEIDKLDLKIREFSHYPDHLDFSSDELIELLKQEGAEKSNKKRIDDELSGIADELKKLVLDTTHLDIEHELESLDVLKNVQINSETELVRLKNQRAQMHAEWQRIAKEYGLDNDSKISEFVLSAVDLEVLSTEIEQLLDARRLIDIEKNEVQSLADRIADKQKNMNSAEQTTSAAKRVNDSLSMYDLDALTAEHAVSQKVTSDANKGYIQALGELTLKGQVFEAVPECGLTAVEIQLLVSQYNDTQKERQAIDDSREDIKAELAELGRRTKQLGNEQGLVSDETTINIKKERDVLWGEHKISLSGRSAEEFEEVMHRLDRAMSVRVIHADKLGELRQWNDRELQLHQKQEHVETHHEKLTKTIQSLESTFAKARSAAGIRSELLPAAFLVWVERCEHALRAQRHLSELLQQHKGVFEKAERLVAALSKDIKRDTPGFDELLGLAKAMNNDYLARRNAEELDLASLKSMQADLDDRQKKLQHLQDDEQLKKSKLEELIGRLLADKISVQQLIISIEPLRTIRDIDRDCADLERQISALEKNNQQFEKRVEEWSLKFGLSSEDTSLQTYNRLKILYQKADESSQRQKMLQQQAQVLAQRTKESTQKLEDIALQVRTYGQVFPDSVETKSVEALRVAVADALDVIQARMQREYLANELVSSLSMSSLEQVRTEATSMTLAQLQARISEIDTDIQSAEENYREAIAAYTASDKDLLSVTGGTEVAMLVEQQSVIGLEMQAAAQRYLKLRLGHRLAEKAIERYRDTHRSSMMQVTETVFRELTNGAYPQLRSHVDDKSQTLLAVDGKGTSLRAHDMSKGTRFQLYLALRAAAYEQLASQGTCLPFICDDIFETFDDERTRSACHVLQRIGQTGQAIYLTHHKHVVDIARDVCADDVCIHRL